VRPASGGRHTKRDTETATVLLVGIVRRPHGLKGELSVEPLTDFPERFTVGLPLLWRHGAQARPVVVRSARPHGKRVLLAFEGVDGVDSARGLCGGELSVEDQDAVPAPDGFYYSHQLEGWRCETLSGAVAGTVLRLERTAAGALLAIRTESGREALVPFVSPIVVTVDEPGRRVVIDPPAGLLEI